MKAVSSMMHATIASADAHAVLQRRYPLHQAQLDKPPEWIQAMLKDRGVETWECWREGQDIECLGRLVQDDSLEEAFAGLGIGADVKDETAEKVWKSLFEPGGWKEVGRTAAALIRTLQLCVRLLKRPKGLSLFSSSRCLPSLLAKGHSERSALPQTSGHTRSPSAAS